MKYQFICECGELKTIEKKMTDSFPVVSCNKCDKTMRRDYSGEWKDKALIIPEHMRALYQTKGQSNFNYKKSPSGKKHFW